MTEELGTSEDERAIEGHRTVAVPSHDEGGLEARRSAHFGHCAYYTLVSVEDDRVVDVRVVENPPHESGGCTSVVGLLASYGTDTLVVGGIGARPLAGFESAGISVYFDDSIPRVGDAVDALLGGGLAFMDPADVCGGSGACGGH
jgi:predicted Fe-Mo cluster-binding NifX family protein